jgi:hypothetical protein
VRQRLGRPLFPATLVSAATLEAAEAAVARVTAGVAATRVTAATDDVLRMVIAERVEFMRGALAGRRLAGG